MAVIYSNNGRKNSKIL